MRWTGFEERCLLTASKLGCQCGATAACARSKMQAMLNCGVNRLLNIYYRLGRDSLGYSKQTIEEASCLIHFGGRFGHNAVTPCLRIELGCFRKFFSLMRS